uniref:myosin-11-like n=1 Tax=Myxine glutinosa TaxID=7769 RepID=UPI00358DEA34
MGSKDSVPHNRSISDQGASTWFREVPPNQQRSEPQPQDDRQASAHSGLFFHLLGERCTRNLVMNFLGLFLESAEEGGAWAAGGRGSVRGCQAPGEVITRGTRLERLRTACVCPPVRSFAVKGSPVAWSSQQITVPPYKAPASAMPPSISLGQLAELAIGSPEPGVVNFGALRSLLLALIEHSGAGAVVAEAPEPRTLNVPDVVKLEERVISLERYFSELASSADLLLCGQRERQPVQHMWQMIQMQKCVEANSSGVTKTMSLLQDMMHEINGLKLSQDVAVQDIERIKAGMDAKMQEVWKHLEEINNMNEKITGHDEVLQKMQEIWKHLEEINTIQENITGQDAISKALGEKVDALLHFDTKDLMTWQTFQEFFMPGGKDPPEVELLCEHYKDVVKILQDVASLPERHVNLSNRVDSIESIAQSSSLNLSKLQLQMEQFEDTDWKEGLLEEMEKLKESMNRLHGNTVQDSFSLTRLQKSLAEQEKASKQLHEELKTQKERFHKVFEQLEGIEIKKADKEQVEQDIDEKADKEELYRKLSTSRFDTTTNELNRMIHELLGKLEAHEHNWQDLQEQLTAEVDKKLDRMELEPLKKRMEERWKNMKKQLQRMPQIEANDAAGFREQLLTRLHCIACNRPVQVQRAPPLITVPNARGFPAMRTARPHTVYDIEHIRQHARSDRDLGDYAYWASMKMGGTARRCIRTAAPSAWGKVPNQQASHIQYKPFTCCNNNEVDILGVDGHIYKGRLDTVTPDRSQDVSKSSSESLFMPPTHLPRLYDADLDEYPSQREGEQEDTARSWQTPTNVHRPQNSIHTA